MVMVGRDRKGFLRSGWALSAIGISNDLSFAERIYIPFGVLLFTKLLGVSFINSRINYRKSQTSRQQSFGRSVFKNARAG
jgi:hypothetical protein